MKTAFLILHYRSIQTLQNSLVTWINSGIFEAGPVYIYVNDYSQDDIDLIKKLPFRAIFLDRENIGIGPALRRLVDVIEEEYFVFLENDWIINPEVNLSIVDELSNILASGSLQYIRLRSVARPGEPLYSRVYFGREGSPDASPFLLDCIHWRDAEWISSNLPVIKFSQFNGLFFAHTTSRYGNYSNNPFITEKIFFMGNISTFTGSGLELEGNIRSSWEDGQYRVGHYIPGLFTHFRMDR